MRNFIILITGFLLIINFSCKKEENSIPVPGFLNFISGTVELIDEKGVSKNAKIGDEIVQGMKIKTVGEKSFADIYIGDYVVKVLGNTVVDVKKLFETVKDGHKDARFSVEKGRLFSRITAKLAKGDVFEVTTPTATAAVRGTEFLVSEENGKSNVACLSGMVAVLNNSLSDSKTVVLDPKEETDIIPGQNMVKKQISADKMRKLNILLQIKTMREDIRIKFEQQREEIRKHVKDQREKDKDILTSQKEKDKALVEHQKKTDKTNVENIKGTTKDISNEALDSAKKTNGRSQSRQRIRKTKIR